MTLAETTTYSGHGCTGLVGQHVVALVRCDPQDDLVAAMWPCVARGDLPTLLIALMSRLANLPDFALVQIHERRAVVLTRGAMQVHVFDGEHLLRTIAAGAVTTWHEDSFEGADRVRLVGPSPAPDLAVPLVGGVVAASRLDHPIVWGAPTVAVVAPSARSDRLPSSSQTTGTWDDRAESGQSTADPVVAIPAVAWQSEVRGILPDRPSIADLPAEPLRQSTPPPAVPQLQSPLLPNQVRRSATRGGDTDMAVRVPIKARSFAAVRCPKLHLNPPATPACRVCHLPLDPDDEPISVPQPSVGHLRRHDTGERWELNRPVVILGREPGQTTSLERLVVTLSGASPRVANLHAEIRLDGWRVEVVDLSGQSTQIINPDGRTLRLEPNSPMRLLENGRLILAGVLTLTFEVTSDISA